MLTFELDPRSTSIPAFSLGAPVTSLFNVIMLSLTVISVVLTVVVVPFTVKSPLTTRLPATVVAVCPTLKRSASETPSYVLKSKVLESPDVPSKSILAPTVPPLPLKRNVGTLALLVLLSVR